MICDLCSANPNVVGNSDFLKGCSNFKKETVRKHAISNCHIRAREMSHSKEKSIAESQIAQSFSKINKDMQFQEQKEMEAKINTAYFVAKEELPFSKFEGLLSLQRKNGVTLNNTYANNTSCAELVSFLSDSFRDDLICEVNSKNYFSLMADGTADFGGTENETVVCRLITFNSQFRDKDYNSLWKMFLSKDSYKSDLKDILHLVEILLVLPILAAGCERMVSSQNRIKSSLRASLKTSSLEGLIRISAQGPSLEEFDPLPSVNRWFARDRSKGERQRRPNFSR